MKNNKKGKDYDIILAFCASLVQCYDYALFGLSASFITSYFMPNNSLTEASIIFFASFSIAFIARPFGAILFGFIGDKYGRINALRISTLLAAISVGTMGLVPSFASIGIYAPIILTLCRMVFIISLAGEIDAARIFLAEKIGKKHKNLAIGLVSSFSQLGALIASIIFYFSFRNNIINSQTVFYWRLCFIAGSACGFLLFFLRLFMKNYQNLPFNSKISVINLKLIYQERKNFIYAILLNGCFGAIYNFLVVFVGHFASKINNILSVNESYFMKILLIGVYSFSAFLSGLIGDKISANTQNNIKQIKIALILQIILIAIISFLRPEGKIFLLSMTIIMFLSPFYIVPYQILLQELFDKNIRMRFCTLAHSIGSMLISSTTPFISTVIWQYSLSFNYILLYFVIINIIPLYLSYKIFTSKNIK